VKRKKNRIRLTLEFDLSRGTDEFVKFAAALRSGGFEYLIFEMAEALRKEAGRRGIELPCRGAA
jgi:hypothetical protein